MDLFDTTYTALERAISGSSLRNEVLANNLANANTPGYRRMEVDFHSVLAKALETGASPEQVREIQFTAETDPSGATRVDGSSVDVDKEMAGLSENALEYQTLVATLRAQSRMLATVITGGRA